jgi:UDP:flavonoid glycosyltransferase YjiC (YdhE family)
VKIIINTFGTRGDVQPYIALARGLGQAGHSVRILTHQIFEHFVRDYDLDFYPLDLDPREVMVNQALSELGNNTIRITRWMKENFKPVLREIFEITQTASQDAELMLNSGLSFAGWHISEKMGIPSLAAFLWPMTPSRHFLGAVGKTPPKWLPFRGLVNYYTTKLFNQLFYNLMLPSVNECRVEVLGIRPMKACEYWVLDSPQNPTPIIYGYSSIVVPKPSDWSNNQQISGYWFLNTAKGYTPEKKLLEFLEKGEPPVYIGFGSLVEHNQAQIQQIVIDALRKNNRRGILQSGWSGFGSQNLPDSVLLIDATPHDWLFPRMAAVVHHGGAGTTATGLRAGIPNVILPAFGDQFFWGRRVQELGVGPGPIPRKKLTADRLANAIHLAVTEKIIRDNAHRIGRQIRGENGVENAVEMIEGFVRDGHL